MKIYYLDDWQYWYDKQYRCWFAAQYGADDCQIGGCLDNYCKEGIVADILREIS